MDGSSSDNAGFSTIEILVAFAVLSLGLGIAVQTIAQSSASLKRADYYREEKLLLRRLIAEELPRLATGSSGLAEITGPNWKVSTMAGPSKAHTARAAIEISSATGHRTYLVEMRVQTPLQAMR